MLLCASIIPARGRQRQSRGAAYPGVQGVATEAGETLTQQDRRWKPALHVVTGALTSLSEQLQADKSDNLSLFPEPLWQKVGTLFLQRCPLTSTHVLWYTCPCTQAHLHTKKARYMEPNKGCLSLSADLNIHSCLHTHAHEYTCMYKLLVS